MAKLKAIHRVSPRQLGVVNEWVTWGVRGVLMLLGSLILWQVRSVQQMHEDVAVIKTVVDSHSHQIQEIWERFRKP